MTITAILRIWWLPLRICIAAFRPREPGSAISRPSDVGEYAIEFYLSARHERNSRGSIA